MTPELSHELAVFVRLLNQDIGSIVSALELALFLIGLGSILRGINGGAKVIVGKEKP